MTTKSLVMRWLGALVVVVGLVASPAQANDVASVESPGGVLRVSVAINGEGRVSYRIDRKGQPVVADSRLGFILADAPKLERNFTMVDSSTSASDTTWEQPWGERRFVRDRHRELRVRLREAKAPVPAPAARELTVVFRVFDDGVGFRYEFPQQAAHREDVDEV